MTASICLRISLNLSDEKLARLDAIGPLVSKVTSAFLEGRWRWPKSFHLETPFIFTLTDRKASALDVEAIRHLAEELQLKLFGTSDSGEVTLLLLDANEADTAQFIAMDHTAIRDALKEPIQPTPFGGRLLTVNSAQARASSMRWHTLEREEPRAARSVLAPMPAVAERARVPVQTAASAPTPPMVAGIEADLRGIYFTPRQFFVGSMVAATAPGRPSSFSLVEGAERLPGGHAEEFDMSSLQAGLRCLAGPRFTGLLFLPICFSSLMRRSSREFYEQLLNTLPAERHHQLAACVYDVPRAPSFPAMTQLHDVLSRHFNTIDLQVEDAGFEIDKLPPGAITCVTYRLPKGDERMRRIAARRFMSQRETFKRLKIWPAITDVRTADELRVCLRERTPFLTGTAICGSTSQPVGGKSCGLGGLPLNHAA